MPRGRLVETRPRVSPTSVASRSLVGRRGPSEQEHQDTHTEEGTWNQLHHKTGTMRVRGTVAAESSSASLPSISQTLASKGTRNCQCREVQRKTSSVSQTPWLLRVQRELSFILKLSPSSVPFGTSVPSWWFQSAHLVVPVYHGTYQGHGAKTCLGPVEFKETYAMLFPTLPYVMLRLVWSG